MAKVHASENADEALNALDAMISYFNGVAQLRHIKKVNAYMVLS